MMNTETDADNFINIKYIKLELIRRMELYKAQLLEETELAVKIRLHLLLNMADEAMSLIETFEEI